MSFVLSRRTFLAWAGASASVAVSSKAGARSRDLPRPMTLVVGDAAPDFTLTDTKNVAHALSTYRGSAVVLEWTNHECPYVAKHYGTRNMQRLQAEATVGGAIWLSIVSAGHGGSGFISPADANQLTRSRGASPTAVLLDCTGEVGRLFGAMTTPHMFVIAPDGNLAYMGAIDDQRSTDPATVPIARNFVREALADLRAGRPVATAFTAPYGCSIKYPAT